MKSGNRKEKEMSTKSKLLELLEKQKGSYLSGEELAQQLDISRTAVWKAMRKSQAGGISDSGCDK